MALIAGVQYSGTPAGTILPCANNAALPQTLLCDGSAVSRTTYAALFAAISTAYGSGDGSTTFNIPDLRFTFARGYGAAINGNGSGTVASNNAIFTNHGIKRTGFRIRYVSGTLTGISTVANPTTIDYYAIVIDNDTIAFASSYANAIAGSKLTISGSNSAVIQQWEDPDFSTRLQAAVGGNASGLATRQEDQFKTHVHQYPWGSTIGSGGEIYSGNQSNGVNTFTPNTLETGGNQTNSRNVYVNYCIAY